MTAGVSQVAVEGSAKLGMDIQFFNGDSQHQIVSMCAPVLATVLLSIGIYWLRNWDWKTAAERVIQFLQTLRYRWKVKWPAGAGSLLRPAKTPSRDPAAYKYIGKVMPRPLSMSFPFLCPNLVVAMQRLTRELLCAVARRRERAG
eukprot:2623159-Rhodomonas_salina.1